MGTVVGNVMGRLVGRLVVWLVGRLVGKPVGRMVRRLVGSLGARVGQVVDVCWACGGRMSGVWCAYVGHVVGEWWANVDGGQMLMVLGMRWMMLNECWASVRQVLAYQTMYALHSTITNAAEITCKLLNKHQLSAQQMQRPACWSNAQTFASFKATRDKETRSLGIRRMFVQLAGGGA